ncbi:hypothetical protein [Mycobacterium phage WXIN]|nr:hypothetical protein [Mycobacterium phage WXIN]
MIPFFDHLDKRREHLWDSVEYRPGQYLDLWMPESAYHAPVMMWIPGGGWVWGDRRYQGYALMDHLVKRGWICASIGYRTAPKNHWPAPFEDVQAAWQWVIDHAWEYGGGDFTAVAGASAGGHMASLLGLTSNNQPDAVVSLYGVYDWTSRSLDHWLINRFVETVVVGSRDRETLKAASPIRLVHEDAPPFLIVHGTGDAITPVSGARKFESRLATTSAAPVQYHEIPGAVHGFDLVHAGQTRETVSVVDEFLTSIRQHRRAA